MYGNKNMKKPMGGVTIKIQKRPMGGKVYKVDNKGSLFSRLQPSNFTV